MQVFIRRCLHHLKQYECSHFQFVYSRRTINTAENKNPSGLCPTQTSRVESTDRAIGESDSDLGLLQPRECFKRDFV